MAKQGRLRKRTNKSAQQKVNDNNQMLSNFRQEGGHWAALKNIWKNQSVKTK